MAPAQSLTGTQFAALAALLSLRGGPATEAARLVLVDGVAVPAAAQKVGISYKTGHAAVQRCRKGIELAREVVGVAARE